MNNKRGQAALEFLMTYGWAIMVVLVVIGALSYFGVLNPSALMPERCTLTPGLGCDDFLINTNGVSLKISNSLGKAINISNLSISQYDGDSKVGSCIYIDESKKILNGGSETIKTNGTCSSDLQKRNNKQTFNVNVTYYFLDSGASFSRVVQGEIFGKVQ